MKIGSKLYYEKSTGMPILLTHEQNSQFARETTREQDFMIYSELMGRNPETVEMLQLEYGQHRGDFEKASFFKVDLETKEVLFEFPEFARTHEVIINDLKAENEGLKAKVTDLEAKNARLAEQLETTQGALDALILQ